LSSYTVGFDGYAFADERPYARLAAKTFGSQHHEMTITCKEFQEFLPKFVWHMEEPVCEPPAVALYYVSKLASTFVKVLLSGEGGDEAFAGYPNYRNFLWLERLKMGLGPLTGVASTTLTTINRLLKLHKLGKYARLLQTPLDSYYYSRTSGPWSFFKTSERGGAGVIQQYFAGTTEVDIVNRMLYVDTKTWLPDDLLIKADKMTMANSVELRVPLLDHKVLEFAAALPGSYKVRGLTTKYIAKRALSKRVPSQILNRKKDGFPVPYHEWLRTEMSGWVRDLLLDSESHTRTYFTRAFIEDLLLDNVRTGLHAKEIFALIVLELWHRIFVSTSQHAVA
jgi:asparagine synthase (glutamine-hydrolysing)